MNIRNMSRERCFIAVIAIVSIALLLLPTGYENPTLTQNLHYEKAKVVSVDNSEMEHISVVTLGCQTLELELLSGTFRGKVTTARNDLVGDKRRDKIFSVGDKVLSIVRVNDSQEILEVRAEEFYRRDLIMMLIAAFVVALILFTGATGARSALSFIFTALSFWKILIPALLSGISPLLTSIGVVFLTTTAIILLVGGLSRRGGVALMGAISGVVMTAILAMVFGALFKIPMGIQEYSDALLYAGYVDLNISDMFISCIFISSAGAVMDVAMDIAAAQDELNHKAPQLTRSELIKSGIRIASPVVGSMTTTLLFAYSSSFLFAFMAFMAQGLPFEVIINRGFIAAEILHTMVGSFGLVLVAPLTALLGGYIFKR